MTDSETARLKGASVWERELYEHLTQHVRNEGAILQQYAAAAEATDSLAFAYVVNLLFEDERRHHALFQGLAESLAHDAEFRKGDPTIPRLDFDRLDSEAVRTLTDALLTNERRDLRALRKLRRQVRDLEDTTLWGLVIDLMQHDTKKHIALLTFVQDHT